MSSFLTLTENVFFLSRYHNFCNVTKTHKTVIKNRTYAFPTNIASVHLVMGHQSRCKIVKKK